MKALLFYFLAFTGGVFLAIQAGFNTQLSGFLKQPVFAAIVTSVFSVLFSAAFILASGKEMPAPDEIRLIPGYLWGIGGLFSLLGVSLYFYTIPKLGVSKMIALGLCGQLIFSLIAGKFGWFNLPVEPITVTRLLGTGAMIIGIVLINNN